MPLLDYGNLLPFSSEILWAPDHKDTEDRDHLFPPAQQTGNSRQTSEEMKQPHKEAWTKLSSIPQFEEASPYGLSWEDTEEG